METQENLEIYHNDNCQCKEYVERIIQFEGYHKLAHWITSHKKRLEYDRERSKK